MPIGKRAQFFLSTIIPSGIRTEGMVASKSPPRPSKGSQRLKRELAEWGKQKEVHEKTGISQSWLSKLENGATASLDDAFKLEEALGIPAGWWRLPAEPESGSGEHAAVDPLKSGTGRG